MRAAPSRRRLSHTKAAAVAARPPMNDWAKGLFEPTGIWRLEADSADAMGGSGGCRFHFFAIQGSAKVRGAIVLTTVYSPKPRILFGRARCRFGAIRLPVARRFEKMIAA